MHEDLDTERMGFLMGADFGDDMGEQLVRLMKEATRDGYNYLQRRQQIKQQYFIESQYKGLEEKVNSQGEAVCEFALTNEHERDDVLKYLKDKDVEVEPLEENKIVFNKKDMSQVEDAVRMYKQDLMAESEVALAELKEIERSMEGLEEAIVVENELDKHMPSPKTLAKTVEKAQPTSLADRAANVTRVSEALEKGNASIARDKMIDKAVPAR